MTSNHKVEGSSPSRDVIIRKWNPETFRNHNRSGKLQKKLVNILLYNNDAGISTRMLAKLSKGTQENTRRALLLLKNRGIVYSYIGVINNQLKYWKLTHAGKVKAQAFKEND